LLILFKHMDGIACAPAGAEKLGFCCRSNGAPVSRGRLRLRHPVPGIIIEFTATGSEFILRV